MGLPGWMLSPLQSLGYNELVRVTTKWRTGYRVADCWVTTFDELRDDTFLWRIGVNARSTDGINIGWMNVSWCIVAFRI